MYISHIQHIIIKKILLLHYIQVLSMDEWIPFYNFQATGIEVTMSKIPLFFYVITEMSWLISVVAKTGAS
jgi:hypothetical protein